MIFQYLYFVLVYMECLWWNIYQVHSKSKDWRTK